MYIDVLQSTSDIFSVFFFLIFLQFTIIYPVNSRFEIVFRKGGRRSEKITLRGQHSWPTRVGKQQKSISLASFSWWCAKRPTPPSHREIEEACLTMRRRSVNWNALRWTARTTWTITNNLRTVASLEKKTEAMVIGCQWPGSRIWTSVAFRGEYTKRQWVLTSH